MSSVSWRDVLVGIPKVGRQCSSTFEVEALFMGRGRFFDLSPRILDTVLFPEVLGAVLGVEEEEASNFPVESSHPESVELVQGEVEVSCRLANEEREKDFLSLLSLGNFENTLWVGQSVPSSVGGIIVGDISGPINCRLELIGKSKLLIIKLEDLKFKLLLNSPLGCRHNSWTWLSGYFFETTFLFFG